MERTFTALSEARPGPKWRDLFQRHWPVYRSWFLSDGVRARPSYAACERALRKHLPELLPTYERLVELTGGGDLEARFLSLYRPPAYLSGCSQAVWSGPEPLLMRNYDYYPRLLEGTLLHSCWNGRTVIASGDSLWGVLDGINSDGLAVSLTFGGRRVTGDGFGVPLILRYVLEFCSTVREGVEVLTRVPSHMPYNVTLLDRAGRFRTVYIGPDRPARVLNTRVATNHQEQVDWPQHAQATATVERERLLLLRLTETDDPARLIRAFLSAPVYATDFEQGIGTLYTAVLDPLRGRVDYLWPRIRWTQHLDEFEEATRTIRYRQQRLKGGKSP